MPDGGGSTMAMMAGSQVLGGLMGADAAQSAADVQAAAARDAASAQLLAAREANQLSEKIYNQQRADYAPYRKVGTNALAALSRGLGLPSDGISTDDGSGPLTPEQVTSLYQAYFGRPPSQQEIQWQLANTPSAVALESGIAGAPEAVARGASVPNKLFQAREAVTVDQDGNIVGSGDLLRDFSMADFEQDPGYGFRLSEGMKALEGSAAARGKLLSGAMLKGITRYGQDYASNEYGNAYNRFNNNQTNKYNRLASMAGVGQTATGQIGSAGQNYANTAGGNLMGGTGAANNALMSGAAARASGYVGASNAIGGGFSGAGNAYYQNQLLNRLMPQQTQSYGNFNYSTFPEGMY